ncbi:hypothetical protein LR004_00815 [Candidatus Gracilibacteria bacterium]|nr:hypothetical protein [Candidatus Gracilibacteria bacterium]
MKKTIIYIILVTVSLGIFALGVNAAGFDASHIIPTKDSGTISDVDFSKDTNLLDKLLTFVKDSIFGILALVAIGMFLYVGFSLVKAQGNPEELKKAFMTLIHVIIGLFIVAISWAVITMASSITF